VAFITEERAACLRAFHELWELGHSDYQNFNQHFENLLTDQYSADLATKPTTDCSLPVQLPDSGYIIEDEIRNGLLQQPTIALNGIILPFHKIGNNSENKASKHKSHSSSPPPTPIMSTLTAIQYITELHRFYQSLPITHLPNPDSKIPPLVLSKLISQAEKIKKSLLRFDIQLIKLSVLILIWF